MFVKSLWGSLTNILLAESISMDEFPVGSHTHSVAADFPDQESMILYAGTADECQKYMAELEKELAAFGKLIRVELPADSEKCTCGHDGKPVWEHAENCAIYTPF